MDKPEALRLADELTRYLGCGGTASHAAAELRRLHAENERLAAALASSCDEQRHELWESGGVAGCERARVAERQRDALLEALKWLDRWMSDKTMPECRWKVRGTIKAVEGEKT